MQLLLDVRRAQTAFLTHYDFRSRGFSVRRVA